MLPAKLLAMHWTGIFIVYCIFGKKLGLTEKDAKIPEYSFFSGGLLYKLLVKAGLAQPSPAGVGLRASIVVLLTYVPVLFLAAAQNLAWSHTVKLPFLFDITEACRFLVVAPLLIVAESIVDPWIRQVVRSARTRLIPLEFREQYDNQIRRAVRQKDSYIIEILLLSSTFGWQFLETMVIAPTAYSSWHQAASSSEASYAYLWSVYIAKPIVRFLWLRWIWRYLVWSLLLLRLASMPIIIKPAYPDRRGGLGSIANGHKQFAVLALAFGVQAAGVLATQMIYDGKTLMSFKYEIAGIVAIVLAIFLTPLLAFMTKLVNAKRVGLDEYGGIAHEYTAAFHAKWISAKNEEQLLGNEDIQSLANLGFSYQVVREMNVSLISKEIITTYVFATLLPFTPLFLIVYPFDELIKNVLKAVM